ncbi:MAG: hypothetical protein KJ896_02585 [Nanoarchaeota archaeon]|nr:hypothetical protein [Nanoarchaeota archaeon]
MEIYIEGILWYLFLLDCLTYGFLSWTSGKLHKKASHWLSGYFPLNKFFSVFYLFLVLWTGFALYRMQIVFNFW